MLVVLLGAAAAAGWLTAAYLEMKVCELEEIVSKYRELLARRSDME